MISTTCCIAGGGPAGMMLGVLLGRAGVPVVVLEKHADWRPDRRRAGHDRRFLAPAGAMPVHRVHAAMGFPGLPRGARPPVSVLRSADGSRGRRPRRGRRPHPTQTLGYLSAGHIFVMLDRGDYWQCAFVIPKGGYDEVRREGLDAFRRTLARIVPFVADRVDGLTAWEDIKLLTVMIDRLRSWYREGLLCIGDAAHAMSPVAGVGINLAVQDAVAASNILAAPLRDRRLSLDALRDYPFLRRLPARAVGLGFRPEHVRTSAAPSAGAVLL